MEKRKYWPTDETEEEEIGSRRNGNGKKGDSKLDGKKARQAKERGIVANYGERNQAIILPVINHDVVEDDFVEKSTIDPVKEEDQVAVEKNGLENKIEESLQKLCQANDSLEEESDKALREKKISKEEYEEILKLREKDGLLVDKYAKGGNEITPELLEEVVNLIKELEKKKDLLTEIEAKEKAMSRDSDEITTNYRIPDVKQQSMDMYESSLKSTEGNKIVYAYEDQPDDAIEAGSKAKGLAKFQKKKKNEIKENIRKNKENEKAIEKIASKEVYDSLLGIAKETYAEIKKGVDKGLTLLGEEQVKMMRLDREELIKINFQDFLEKDFVSEIKSGLGEKANEVSGSEWEFFLKDIKIKVE